MAGERLYRLEPLDASGIFLGLGAVQCALLGAAMFAAVVAISAGLPIGVAALPVLGAAVISFGRVSGLVIEHAARLEPLASEVVRQVRLGGIVRERENVGEIPSSREIGCGASAQGDVATYRRVAASLLREQLRLS